MKKTKLFLLASAGIMTLAGASCSSDNIPGNETPEVNLTGKSYAKVAISMGGNFETRAFGADDQEFDKGTKNESAIKNLMLMIYGEDGTLYGYGTTMNDINLTDNTDNNEVSHDASQIAEITVISPEVTPSSLLAYVNIDITDAETLKEALGASRTSEALKAILPSGQIVSENGLVMTNTGYYDNNNYVVATEISSENIFEKLSEASEAKAVDIYVERVAAKLTVKTELEETIPAYKIYDVDGNEYKLAFDVDNAKWAASALNPSTYVFKKKYDKNLNWFNESKGTHRSYWAEGTLYEKYYDDYVGTNRILDYYSANDLLNTNASYKDKGLGKGKELVPKKATRDNQNAVYLPEHTFGENAKFDGKYEPILTASSALIIGQYKLSKVAGSSTGEAMGGTAAKPGASGTLTENKDKFAGSKEGEFDFYLALNGTSGTGEDAVKTYVAYSKEDLIKRLYNNSKLSKVDVYVGPNEQLKLDAEKATKVFDLYKTETNQYKLKVGKVASSPNTKPQTVTLYQKDKEGKFIAMSESDIADGLTGVSNAKHYLNGWAYFWVPIQHYDKADNIDKEGYYGVVRNHSYNLKITEIRGLAAGLDEDMIGEDPTNPDPKDPDVPIIPNPDEVKEMYINAELHVMSWHNVDQNVKL